MTDTIGWGILATGGIAETFTEDLKTIPDARVAAVGSRTAEAARAFADRFGIPNAHGDWDGLIADDSVDIVYVANTQNAHYDAVKRCLEGGKAVLCEKPFTINHAQAKELTELAGRRNLFLMEAMWTRCNPAIRRMLGELADGVIGSVSTLTADFGLAGPFGPDHRLGDPQRGGGALLDLGVYPVSLAYLVLGMPAVIGAVGARTANGVDMTTGVLLGYERGNVANLMCSISADSPGTAALSGPKGRIELDSPFWRPKGYRVCVGEGDANVRVVAEPYLGHGMVHEAVEAMRCLREGLTESPLVPWQATLEVMSILDGVRAQIAVKFPGE
ncbi:MAG: Gfo/Idh/MocA family protein [Stackebrandtia sp.]